jgi:hypothetical protein
MYFINLLLINDFFQVASPEAAVRPSGLSSGGAFFFVAEPMVYYSVILRTSGTEEEVYLWHFRR